MKFRAKERRESTVDLTSLIDVVFMLLIFFMVTTTFDKNAELKIELPTASNTAAASARRYETQRPPRRSGIFATFPPDPD